jgi:hypothetical protein
MGPEEQSRIAESWLTVQRHWWAWDSLNRLCDEAPLDAWPIIVRLVEMADNDELLEDIGAGPVEELLRKHGPLLLNDVQTLAASDPRFRQVLSHVWLAERDSEVAKSLLDLGCQVVLKAPPAENN